MIEPTGRDTCQECLIDELKGSIEISFSHIWTGGQTEDTVLDKDFCL